MSAEMAMEIFMSRKVSQFETLQDFRAAGRHRRFCRPAPVPVSSACPNLRDFQKGGQDGIAAGSLLQAHRDFETLENRGGSLHRLASDLAVIVSTVWGEIFANSPRRASRSSTLTSRLPPTMLMRFSKNILAQDILSSGVASMTSM